MSTSSRADLTRSLCIDAVFVTVAMMLSYMEVLLPSSLLPLPGFKLGLANVAIMLVFSLVGKRDAAVVSAIRIALMGLLFGNLSSFFFSAMGGLLAYLTLLLSHKLLPRASYVGISVLSAAMHNLGQLLAAVCLYGASIFLSYLPFLLLAACLSGTLTGLLLNLSIPTLQRSIHL